MVVLPDSRINKWEILVCYPYFINNDCGYSTLATYSTEEKALKVLEAFCNFAISKHYECGLIEGIVFQMPQDDEIN